MAPFALGAHPKGSMADRKALQGRTALVTGAGSGIGQAIARRLAEDGANLVIDYAHRSEGAAETLRMVREAGSDGRVVEADVTRMEDIGGLMEAARQAFGGLDILVNNAGVEKRAAFEQVTPEDYDLVLAVNLRGPFFLTQAFVRACRAAGRPGRVINISSVHEDMAFPNFSTYCAAKGGMRMLMRNLAVELGPAGITVNNVAPGAIETPINRSLLEDDSKRAALTANIPLGRMGSTAEVAAVVAFLASDQAAYVTGSTYFVDGGLIRNYHEQ
jgi:glucose 1-dehydrogenase